MRKLILVVLIGLCLTSPGYCQGIENIESQPLDQSQDDNTSETYRPMWEYPLILGFGGALLGFVIDIVRNLQDDDSTSNPEIKYTPMCAAIGAGTGALLGLFVSLSNSQKQNKAYSFLDLDMRNGNCQVGLPLLTTDITLNNKIALSSKILTIEF